jgi:two-component system chemotaxis response regulator CheB
MNSQARNKTIRVLVVDDSRVMASQISSILQGDGRIDVVGTAGDGIEALELIEDLKPDVITLDVEMPRMNGLTALKHVMVKYAIPTVMISALTLEGSKTTFDAFKYGAIDVIAKPSRRQDVSLSGQKTDIINKVKRAADIRTGKSRYVRMASIDTSSKAHKSEAPDSSTRVIGIGAGTGGYYSLLRIIPALPARFDGIVIAVVLAASRYVAPFISYLDDHSAVPVLGATHLDSPRKGTCYVCPGQDTRVLCTNDGTGVGFRLSEGVPEEGGEGPLDAMFGSLASAVGERAVGVVLSGPGADGAEGIARIRKAGGVGVVQDITDCMDPAMPLAVLEKSSVEKILPDFLMAEFLAGLVSG